MKWSYFHVEHAMKSLLILLTLAALCLGGAGCDKPERQPAPKAFEKAIDGSIPLGSIPLDPTALKARPKMELPEASAEAQPVAGSAGSTEPAGFAGAAEAAQAAGAAMAESVSAAVDQAMQAAEQMAVESTAAAGTTVEAQPQEPAATAAKTANEPFKVTDPDDPYGGPLPENPYGPAGGAAGGGNTGW